MLPTFKTKRLLLKPVTTYDIPAYKKHFVEWEVIRHLSAKVPWPYPDDGVKQFVSEFIVPNQGKDRWVWGIFLQESPVELIGVVDLWRKGCPEHRGFWLGRSFWGQGFMTEAVIPVIDYAFGELGFETLIFSNAVGNIRSRRVKEKTGATFVKVLPTKFVDPTLTEREVWELSKSNWLDYRQKLPTQ